ncbi:MAG: hypothetical protein GXP09_06280 [Gammaproteobacteria bacterium]|nr:hypothetical protein [Gammaproteobacteria bacterium]
MIDSAWIHKNTTLWVITAVAVVILAGVIVDSIKRVRDLLDRDPVQATPPARAFQNASPRYLVTDIISAHLFGQADTPVSPSQLKAPETRLNLKLLGVVAAEGGSGHGRAIIEVVGKGVKSYEIGQTLEHTDAKLKAVGVSRVLIDRKGVIESLPLKRDAVDMDGNTHPSKGVMPGVAELSGDGMPNTTSRVRTKRSNKTTE